MRVKMTSNNQQSNQPIKETPEEYHKRGDPNAWHVDEKIRYKWNKIKDGRLKKKDDDRVYVVDGRERTGKSIFTFQQAAYIDPSMLESPEEFCSRICFTAEEFLEAIRKFNSTETCTKCIVFDEAFRGLSSRAATSKVNKKILQSLMEVGQKNLVLWIVLPSFFMLDLYPAMLRSNALFHIKKDRDGKRRSFGVYSYKKKALLYQIGVRKGWQYFPTRNIGRFYNKFPGGEAFEKAYRAKKYAALTESDIDNQNTDDIAKRRSEEIDNLIIKLSLEGKTHKEIYEELIKAGEPISSKSIQWRISKARRNQIIKEDRERKKAGIINK